MKRRLTSGAVLASVALAACGGGGATTTSSRGNAGGSSPGVNTSRPPAHAPAFAPSSSGALPAGAKKILVCTLLTRAEVAAAFGAGATVIGSSTDARYLSCHYATKRFAISLNLLPPDVQQVKSQLARPQPGISPASGPGYVGVLRVYPGQTSEQITLVKGQTEVQITVQSSVNGTDPMSRGLQAIGHAVAGRL